MSENSITVDGITVSFSDIEALANALPQLIASVGAHQSAQQIVGLLDQSVLPIIENIANVLYPGAGTAIEIIAFFVEHSRKMTPQEEELWMDRASEGAILR